MSTVVTTSSAADFLAVVPHLVGFEPHNSIVFVAFRGRRTCGAMRFDLPEQPSSPADDTGSKLYKRVATTLVGMLSKVPGVDAVVPVVYTQQSFDVTDGTGGAGGTAGAGGPPRAAFVRAVIARFEFSGFQVRDALCIASDGWGSYFDDKCPPQGRPLAKITESRILDDLPEHATRPLGDVAQWARLPEVAQKDRRRVQHWVALYSEVIDGRVLVGGGSPRDDDRFDDDWFDDAAFETYTRENARLLGAIPPMLEVIFENGVEALDPKAAGFIITLARLPAIRDVVMMQWSFDVATGRRVLNDARRFALGAPAEVLNSGPLMLGRGPRPDPERIDRAIEILKRVAALASKQQRPPVLCMLAWLNWALGRSSVAARFIGASEEIDPDYGLGEVMRAVLEHGMLPEWAFVSDS